jgi:hypothetical protein
MADQTFYNLPFDLINIADQTFYNLPFDLNNFFTHYHITPMTHIKYYKDKILKNNFY